MSHNVKNISDYFTGDWQIVNFYGGFGQKNENPPPQIKKKVMKKTLNKGTLILVGGRGWMLPYTLQLHLYIQGLTLWCIVKSFADGWFFRWEIDRIPHNNPTHKLFFFKKLFENMIDPEGLTRLIPVHLSGAEIWTHQLYICYFVLLKFYVGLAKSTFFWLNSVLFFHFF